LSRTSGAVTVEITSWVTRLVGGDGVGRRVFEEPLDSGATVRTILTRLTARHPELAGALWSGRELGEHLEVLVNDAVLGIDHELDSPLKPGDRIALLPQFTGG
jgi:molybdopterin converting factor small subunit